MNVNIYQMLPTFQSGSQLLSMISLILKRIPPKCTQKLIKFAKKWKHENANIYINHSTNFLVWFTTTFYEFGKSLRGYMMIVSPKCPQKLRKFDEKMKAWKCEYLLNHSTNFLVWFTTTFSLNVANNLEKLRGYMMIASLLENIPQT